VFKYVGVAGVDKPRIVQVGVGAENLRIANEFVSSSTAAQRLPARLRQEQQATGQNT
jgi:hypothetical protein